MYVYVYIWHALKARVRIVGQFEKSTHLVSMTGSRERREKRANHCLIAENRAKHCVRLLPRRAALTFC